MTMPRFRRTFGRLPSIALVAVMLSALALAVAPSTAFANGVVGNGTPGSCTDAAFGTALASGGNVTFNCGPDPVTIVVTEKTITTDTTIDGGGKVTLSGNSANRVFCINNSYVTLGLAN